MTEPTLYLLFSKQSFQNYFCAFSRGFCPSFSNSPTPAACPQIFSDVSTPIFHPCLSQALPDWTKPASLYYIFCFSPKSMSDRREGHTTTPNHHYTYFFQNKIFKIIFGPFPGVPGAFAPHFRIPLLPLHILKFFLTFLHQFFIPVYPGLFQALPDRTKPASLYSIFTFSPMSMSDRRESHTTYYISRGPRDFCP